MLSEKTIKDIETIDKLVSRKNQEIKKTHPDLYLCWTFPTNHIHEHGTGEGAAYFCIWCGRNEGRGKKTKLFLRFFGPLFTLEGDSEHGIDSFTAENTLALIEKSDQEYEQDYMEMFEIEFTEEIPGADTIDIPSIEAKPIVTQIYEPDFLSDYPGITIKVFPPPVWWGPGRIHKFTNEVEVAESFLEYDLKIQEWIVCQLVELNKNTDELDINTVFINADKLCMEKMIKKYPEVPLKWWIEKIEPLILNVETSNVALNQKRIQQLKQYL